MGLKYILHIIKVTHFKCTIIFSKRIVLWSSTQCSFEHFHHPHQKFLVLIYSISSFWYQFPQQPQATTNLHSVFINFLLWTFHVSGIIYVVSCVWHLSLSIMFLWFLSDCYEINRTAVFHSQRHCE